MRSSQRLEFRIAKFTRRDVIALSERASEVRSAVKSAPLRDDLDGIVGCQKLLLGLLEPIGQQILVRGAVDIFAEAADEMRRAHTA